MSPRDRRLEPRKSVSLPIRFRVQSSASLDMYNGDAVNMSDHGIYFRTPRPLTVGDALEVVLTMPSELTGRPREDCRCQAQVVRVEWVQEPGVCAACGIRIQGREIIELPSSRVSSSMRAIERTEKPR
jgi:PilZ domain